MQPNAPARSPWTVMHLEQRVLGNGQSWLQCIPWDFYECLVYPLFRGNAITMHVFINVVIYSNIQRGSTLLYSTLLYSILHYSTLLYSTLLYSTLNTAWLDQYILIWPGIPWIYSWYTSKPWYGLVGAAASALESWPLMVGLDYAWSPFPPHQSKWSNSW